MAKLFSGILAIVFVTFFALYVITATADEEDALLACVKKNLGEDCSAEETTNVLKMNSLSQLETISECLDNNGENCGTVAGSENTDQINSVLDCALSEDLLIECMELIEELEINQ